MLNFNVLKNYDKAAIRCNREQSLILCDEMFDQYPTFMRYYKRGDSKYNLVNGSSVCYAPHIFDGEETHMQLTVEKYWVDHGYTILPFEALLEAIQDFGDIPKLDVSIESLFVI